MSQIDHAWRERFGQIDAGHSAAHGVTRLAAVANVYARGLRPARDRHFGRGVTSGRRMVGRSFAVVRPAAGVIGVRVRQDDVPSGLQAINAVDSAIICQPLQRAARYSRWPSVGFAHADGEHLYSDHRFARGVRYAAGDHAAPDQSDLDVLARPVIAPLAASRYGGRLHIFARAEYGDGVGARGKIGEAKIALFIRRRRVTRAALNSDNR